MSELETGRILDAAQQLIHEQGRGFTMEQLEERVGLSGLLYDGTSILGEGNYCLKERGDGKSEKSKKSK